MVESSVVVSRGWPSLRDLDPALTSVSLKLRFSAFFYAYATGITSFYAYATRITNRGDNLS